MVVEHTIDTFESNPHIHEIAIVSNPFYISDFESIIIKNGWKKVKKILKGGQERYHSSLSAIKAYEDTDVNLIFHDAVRPLVSQRILNDVIAALETYKAIDVAMPATDTIIQVNDRFIQEIPDRSKLMRGQTPQAFHLETIKHAYDIALQDPAFKVTDDCGVVVKYLPEVPVYVVNGEESNMKLTYKEDTYLLDKFFQLRKSELNTLPIDQENNLKNRVAVVFGGSYGIGADVAQLLKEKGANVFCYSRSMNGTQAFMKVAPSELPDTLFLQTPESDPTSKEPIVKIRDLNSIYIEAGDTFSVEYQKGLYVDIFPFIDYPTVPRPWAKKLCKGISVSYSILHAQHYYSLRSFAEFFYFGMKYALFKGIWAMLCLVRPKGTYLSNILINNGYGIMHRKDSVFPLSTITFEGKDFPAPGNVDAYLKDLYKNYMDIPPKEKQIVHACYIHPELKPLP